MADAPADLRTLLEANHAFPGPYFLSVITVSSDDVFAALRAAVEVGLPSPLAETDWIRHASSAGRYTSHRVTVHCESVDDVLALYARVRAVAGVVQAL